jgi:dTMP kinase
MSRGRFIVFEGGEACGKSTQASLLAERLGARLTFEPGDTPLGTELRKLLLDPNGSLTARTELLLMLADRAEHVATVIEPTLAAGQDVVCDRFSGSTLAYQGFGRGLPLAELEAMSTFAAGGLEPDLVLLLEVEPAVAAARLSGERDRIEAAIDGFHERVAAGFRTLAAHAARRWEVVDGSGDVETVRGRIEEILERRWPGSSTR